MTNFGIPPLLDLPNEMLHHIALYLEPDDLMNVSGSCWDLHERFIDKREKIKSGNNWGTEREFTPAQAAFARRVICSDLPLEWAVRGSQLLFANRARATKEQIVKRHAQLGFPVSENNYPPLRHVLNRDGSFTPGMRRLVRAENAKKLLACAVERVAIATGIGEGSARLSREKRKNAQTAPFAYSREVMQSVVKRVASGESLMKIADDTGISTDTLFYDSLLAFEVDFLRGTGGRYASIRSLDFSGAGIGSLRVNDIARMTRILSIQRGIKELNLADNALTDADAADLANAAARHPTLTTLDLRGANISDATKAHIKQLGASNRKSLLV